jgi:hypothetical protein
MVGLSLLLVGIRAFFTFWHMLSHHANFRITRLCRLSSPQLNGPLATGGLRLIFPSPSCNFQN